MVSPVLLFHWLPQQFVQAVRRAGVPSIQIPTILKMHREISIKKSPANWIRVGLEVFINKSRLEFLSSFPGDQTASIISSSCVVWQLTNITIKMTSVVTSLFSSFCSASLSVAAAPGFSSETSLTLSRPAVGPLEMRPMLLAWFGNLTPKKAKRCFQQHRQK